MSETELREALIDTLRQTLAANALRLTSVVGGYVGGGRPHATLDSDPGAVEAIARGLLARKVALASIPAEPEQADEVAGLDPIVLAQVLAYLHGAPGFSPAFVADAERELARRIADAYPKAVEYRARLAPARDDTSVDCCDCPKCGEWRDSPTADCAACGFDPARDDTSGGAS